MKSFLNIIAADMLAHFTNDMRDVVVVFPGKRAGMFLSREFAILSKEPAWVPQYCTMGDLFQSLTSIEVADQLECICQLHSVMQEVLGKDYTETLDEFWSWGEVLMADFDDIDKHLADARAIFTNIADQERLKSLDYLDNSQRETLQRFFGRFSLENSTRLQEKFLHTWSHMYEIYTKLHERLLAEGKLWEGALFRHVTEQMQADESLVLKLLEGKRAVVFAGFNVLNNVEHTIMSLIQREGKARFYWDYDIYYCNPENDDCEAGYFMKLNLRDFPCAINEEEAFDNFRHLRDVTFIACTTDNAAARYVSTWTGKAIVLCNEALMQPVLHAIPESASEVNVTMGFPIADTPVYGIIMSLLKLQMEGYDADRKRFRYPFVQTLRRQPLFELLKEEECLVYHGNNTAELLDWLLTLLRQIALHYAQIEEPNIFEQLYSETVFRCDRMIKTLSNSLPLREGRGRSLLLRLFRQMMASTKIPFHSEPDRGLQVMGMLETRCLDFENLLLLSVEEGNLPRSTHANSFIPESLREAFGLTTQRHRIAVYAYYFYRLVQRCEHLTCVYNESTNDGVQHEMSRFLRQMLAETDIPIKTRWLRSEPELKATPPLVVEKTAEVMERLRLRYDQSLPDGEHITLSPSAINTYKACPMQFYINNVLRIRREDDAEEGISADIIGNIFHDTAEFFYEWLQERYGTNCITANMLCEEKGEDKFVIKESIHRELQRMLHTVFDVCWFHPTDEFDRLPEIRRRFNMAIQKGSAYKGTTLIAHDVLLRYLQALIRYDARHAPFRIIGAEEERTISLPLREGWGGSVKVGGRIDRIDEMDGRLRIVDYKTGTHESPRYQLQIFLYALAEMEKGESTLPIQPVLFFPIKAAADDYNPSIVINKEVVNDFANQQAATFRESLQEILNDIFDPNKPFTCTTDPQTCSYCKLGQLCGKAHS
ncbi:MAG: PD-(D/E)XK nuclease family protein [Bacteroidaceae bacterium]|nr:PD-(D/E)XK nuclease family protein [Bacteroidaceae bacterium]